MLEQTDWNDLHISYYTTSKVKFQQEMKRKMCGFPQAVSIYKCSSRLEVSILNWGKQKNGFPASALTLFSGLPSSAGSLEDIL